MIAGFYCRDKLARSVYNAPLMPIDRQLYSNSANGSGAGEGEFGDAT